MFRSCVTDRRLLVLLDDAVSERQVRSLMPGSDRSAVIVTARIRLEGLEASQLVALGPFEPGEAIDLLQKIIGISRVRAEPGAAADIVRMCGYLPLAVRIAAVRLSLHPGWSLGEFADRLRDEWHRLDELVAGDLDVRDRFARSYRRLNRRQRQTLSVIGTLRTPEFDLARIAPLLGVPIHDAETLVEGLVDSGLLDVCEVNTGAHSRYHVQELVRLFAQAQRARIAAGPH